MSAGSFPTWMASRRRFGATTRNRRARSVSLAKLFATRISPMVFFKRKEKVQPEPQRLDWRLFERGAIALYYKSSVLSADLGWFRPAEQASHEMHGTAVGYPAACSI